MKLRKYSITTATIMLVTVLAILVVGCSKNHQNSEEIIEKGEQVISEDFCYSTIDGAKVKYSDICSKKLTMINIWGTFCAPCVKEMPELQRISEEYKDKGVEIIGIPIDITKSNGTVKEDILKSANDIIEKTEVKYRNIIPDQKMNTTLLSDVQSVPQTLFVDNEGRMVGNIYYGARSEKDWKLILDTLLESIQ